MAEAHEIVIPLKDLILINNKSESIKINDQKSGRAQRMTSASSVENLSTDVKQLLYMDRITFIKDKLSNITLSDMDIQPEDLVDKHCE